MNRPPFRVLPITPVGVARRVLFGLIIGNRKQVAHTELTKEWGFRAKEHSEVEVCPGYHDVNL